MSGFKALNIESDDESDIEIDDTKELQIEEALKLYQNALKLHSEGPASFEKAAQAYEELFKSDIFKYPESQTELRRIELYGPLPDVEDLWQDGSEYVAIAPTTGFENAPSTLPQILHLSHKNYAQFKLEYLTARLESLDMNLRQIVTDATAALEHFVEALDKDDTDLDLWRRTASVGSLLDSKRTARFCLEAVLEGDVDGLSGALSLPGLEESLAGEQLRDLVAKLGDQLSIFQDSLPKDKRRALSKILKLRLDSYRSIADRRDSLQASEEPATIPQPTTISLPAPSTWTQVGEVLLRQLTAEEQGKGSRGPSPTVNFELDPGSRPQVEPSTIRQEPARTVLAVLESLVLPLSINDQFPGMDDGRPTVQPRIACADANMQALPSASTDEDLTMAESPTMTLPTRKRSGDAAGLNDGTEEGRGKSKRNRTRDSTIAEDSRQAILDANYRWELEQKFAEMQAADDWMFETASNLFERIGIVGFEAGKQVKQEIQNSTKDGPTQLEQTGLSLAKSDLHAFLNNYSDQMAQILTSGNDNMDVSKGLVATGSAVSHSNGSTSKALSRPSLPLDEYLDNFLASVNAQMLATQGIAWRWICHLLEPNRGSDFGTYLDFVWPEDLKTMVVQTLVNFDVFFYEAASDMLSGWKDDFTNYDHGLAELLLSIYELHLDIYCLIKKANSGVDAEKIATEHDALQRWSELAREALHFRNIHGDGISPNSELNLRFLWATTFQINADTDLSQDYIIECMNDLRSILVAANDPVLHLPNNAIMPELSVVALDREISRLTTKDFFEKVTSQDTQDPVAIIESLEPLLESLNPTTPHEQNGDDLAELSAPIGVAPELVRFLEASDVSVRLVLWQRLRDAYIAIDYKPMVMSCYFKMIRIVFNELKTALSRETAQSDRQVMVLRALRTIHDMTSKALSIAKESKDAFECIDETGLKSAVGTFGEVLQLTQVFNVFEDTIRIEQTQEPILSNGSLAATFATAKDIIHKMQAQIWVLLYSLLKEAIFQYHDLFPTPDEDRFDYLKVVHRNLGLRGICGSANGVLVRMLKDEFFKLTHVEGYDSEQAQVLYDLYGYSCFINPTYELMEHNCTHDAFVDRSVALQAVDLLLLQASKLPMKDLIKHPLKETIDKVHGSVPRRKPTEAIQRNREVLRAYLRSPINPLDLFRCLKGEGNHLTMSRVPREDLPLASKGWFFLMGHISLAKFRSVKRTAPTPTEDVDIAIAFFMQNLEYSSEHWETWFRLGQAYDTKIEESVVWSAEKLNNFPMELEQLQRATIHCYAMATALAYRSAKLTVETTEKMTELFCDFATRLYATTREPFSMLPFAVEEDEKFFSIPGQGMSKGKAFSQLRVYAAWKLARVLFQRAIAGKPDSWTLQFALGKCLWKMHSATEREQGQGRELGRHNEPPSVQDVLGTFIRAIELIPDKKDSREKREPILEPHYKLVSIVHKMVSRGSLGLEDAREALQHTPFARNATFPDELDEWVPYVLSVLKNLRNADKSNWHHRMIARAAQIIYDDTDPLKDISGAGQNLGAMGAKHELTQQMFTKTMVLQVWRPESERAGRHFVYTSRYTRFFVRILEQLKDRANLEMLARRMRRRPHDLYMHVNVWQDICSAYLRLLRNYAALPEGLETSTFSTIAHEEFLARKEPLEKWMQAQDTGASAALDVLREVQELKKINQSLMKPGPIDDLIGDAYAYLFNTIGKQLWEEEVRAKQEEEAKRVVVPPPAPPSPPRSSVMNLTSLMNVDGAPETQAAAQPTQPPHAQAPDTTAAAAAAAAAEAVPIRRKIGVGRREIRTCAEACFQKTTTATPSQATPRTLPRVQVVIDRSKEDTAGFVSVENSAPGSVYSADDESELSELEEEGDEEDDRDRDGEGGSSQPPAGREEPLRPMFPGLLSQIASREGSEGFETAEEEIKVEGVGDGEDVDMEMDDGAGQTADGDDQVENEQSAIAAEEVEDTAATS